MFLHPSLPSGTRIDLRRRTEWNGERYTASRSGKTPTIYKDSIFQVSGRFSKTRRFFVVNYAVDGRVGRTLFLREYTSFIKGTMIAELMDYPRNMMLSIDIVPVATDEAVVEMHRRIMAAESDITRWQQRQNHHNNFSASIPYDLEQMRKETREFPDDLRGVRRRAQSAGAEK